MRRCNRLINLSLYSNIGIKNKVLISVLVVTFMVVASGTSYANTGLVTLSNKSLNDDTTTPNASKIVIDSIDLPYHKITDDDDIDAVVDEDALVDIDETDAPDDYLEEDSEAHSGHQTKVDIDTAASESSIDLTIEHVPLNAISPKTIQTFVEVIDTVRHDYVKSVNDEVLFQYAITGMLEKLDNHAEYLTPKRYDKLRSFTDGEIGQVGLTATYDSRMKAWVIDNVLPKSSANEAGIKVGDQLLRIKKVELTEGMQPQDINQLLSGIAGTQVQVTLKSKGFAQRDVVLQRNLSINNKLEVLVQEGIAVVRLPIFQNTTKDQLVDVLKSLNVPISGVVLDVRNNPGGVLSSAIDVASLFIENKGLIQVRNRTNSSQIINPNGVPYLSELPVIVLQNRYSASAAEVLSSSLKSNNRARIVGETSFGKGTVQEVIPLENGGAIKLTVAEYRSIHGDPIDGIGVKPDVTFLHDDSDWQQQAITLLVSRDLPIDVQLEDTMDDVSAVDDY